MAHGHLASHDILSSLSSRHMSMSWEPCGHQTKQLLPDCCYLTLDKTLNYILYKLNKSLWLKVHIRSSYRGSIQRLMGCYDDGAEECPMSEQMYSEITQITSLSQREESEIKP